MKSHTAYITLNIPSKMAYRNITPDVKRILADSGVQEGLCLVKTRHGQDALDRGPCSG
jgi:thiamine phosphate synthase YjbQ (UPF0047 family)